MRTLLWFRGRDLRLEDQPALAAAMESEELIPVAVLDSGRHETPFRSAFLEGSLGRLDAELRSCGSRLVVLEGDAEAFVMDAVQRWGVDRVETLARVEPQWRSVDDRLQARLGHRFHIHIGDTLTAPGSVRTGGGGPFTVFTPFARAFARRVDMSRPLPAPLVLPPLPPELVHLPRGRAHLPQRAALAGVRPPRAVGAAGARLAALPRRLA